LSAAGSSPSDEAGRSRRLPAPISDLPWAAIAVGLGLFLLLTAFVSADPARHVTFSSSPFSDEGFNTVNARNLVQLGRWSTDEWNLYLVNLPYSLLAALAMRLLGVGIVAVRMVSILCVSATALAIAWGLRRTLGTAWATFAGLAFAGSGLVLYYGRLAYTEDLVVLALALGTLVLASTGRIGFRWGVVSGVCFAVAIGAKPSALFAVAGILLAPALVWGWRSCAMRRWIAGAVAAVAVFGLGWAVLVWLPNRDAVAMDLRIWAPIHLRLTPAGQVDALLSYMRASDGIIGRMLGPLLALAAAGTILIAAFRKRLGPDQSRLAVASFGWVLVGFWIVIVADYRPNRYLLPMVPGLAMLAAIGLRQFSIWLTERRTSARWARAAVAIATVAVLVAATPGLAFFYGWNHAATHELPRIQDQMANLVPPGERVAGRESALFLMKSKAITLEVQLTTADTNANAGDLYSRGVRWYLQPLSAPIPPGVSDDVWTNRHTVACGEWGGLLECLVELP
jgi:4-amino-4-deoxy-L-arabinose transferase-like glycosyltransferase